MCSAVVASNWRISIHDCSCSGCTFSFDPDSTSIFCSQLKVGMCFWATRNGTMRFVNPFAPGNCKGAEGIIFSDYLPPHISQYKLRRPFFDTTSFNLQLISILWNNLFQVFGKQGSNKNYLWTMTFDNSHPALEFHLHNLGYTEASHPTPGPSALWMLLRFAAYDATGKTGLFGSLGECWTSCQAGCAKCSFRKLFLFNPWNHVRMISFVSTTWNAPG